MKKLMASLVFGFALSVTGCATSDVMVHTPEEIKQQSPIQAAQSVIDNNNALIAAAARTLRENYEAGLFTNAEAVKYANKIKDAHEINEEAQAILLAGDVAASTDRARAIEVIISVITAELAKIKAEENN